MKRFCCLASVLLLGGCASYYRVVNGIAGEGEAWRKVGKAIFFGVIEEDVEMARFHKVKTEEDGTRVYRATFHPRRVALYGYKFLYNRPRRADGTWTDEKDLDFGAEVEVEVFHNGTLHERSHGKVGWPWISGRIVTHHIPGGVWMKKAPWSRYEEIAIYLRCRDSRFEERLNSNGGRLFVYEYNDM